MAVTSSRRSRADLPHDAALVDFHNKAPAAQIAHPTHEHLAPASVAAAAASEAGRTDVTFPITGFWNDMSFTRRSVQVG